MNTKQQIFTSLAVAFLGIVSIGIINGPPVLASSLQEETKPLKTQKAWVEEQEDWPSTSTTDREQRDSRSKRFRKSREMSRLQLIRMLELSREQWQQSRQLYQRLGPRMQQLRDELEERQDAFDQAMFSEPQNRDLIEQRLQQVLEKQEELLHAQAEIEQGFRGILTPEQLQKFRDLQARQLEIRRLEREVRRKQRQLKKEVQGEQP